MNSWSLKIIQLLVETSFFQPHLSRKKTGDSQFKLGADIDPRWVLLAIRPLQKSWPELPCPACEMSRAPTSSPTKLVRLGAMAVIRNWHAGLGWFKGKIDGNPGCLPLKMGVSSESPFVSGKPRLLASQRSGIIELTAIKLGFKLPISKTSNSGS